MHVINIRLVRHAPSENLIISLHIQLLYFTLLYFRNLSENFITKYY